MPLKNFERIVDETPDSITKLVEENLTLKDENHNLRNRIVVLTAENQILKEKYDDVKNQGNSWSNGCDCGQPSCSICHG